MSIIQTYRKFWIMLTKGQRTCVDAECPGWILEKSWYATFSHGHWYAASRYRGKIILLHRAMTNAESGETVDHINMDTLDNRGANLRRCSYSQNNCNRGGRRGRTSSYKGVSWHKQGQKWQVYIEKDGRNYYLGLYASEKDAALAYNNAALRIHGQFAYLNKLGGRNEHHSNVS